MWAVFEYKYEIWNTKLNFGVHKARKAKGKKQKKTLKAKKQMTQESTSLPASQIQILWNVWTWILNKTWRYLSIFNLDLNLNWIELNMTKCHWV